MDNFTLGMMELVISSLMFGCMFVPLKKFNAGDGMFSQWVTSMAILIVGYIFGMAYPYPGIEPIVVVGGMMWSAGNAITVIIIRKMGMALGIFIWNTANCTVCWLIGTYGLFGITANPASNFLLTGLGLTCILGGGVLFTLVKNNNSDAIPDTANYELAGASSSAKTLNILQGSIPSTSVTNTPLAKKLIFKTDKLFGIAICMFAGTMFGLCVFTVLYIQDNYPEAPKSAFPYLFSFYSGVFFMSTTIFVVYAVVKRNKPRINPSIALPAMLTGIIWSIANGLMLNAASLVSPAITQPISTMLPGCVATLWSVFYFREIRGRNNMLLLVGAIGITLFGSFCIGLSK